MALLAMESLVAAMEMSTLSWKWQIPAGNGDAVTEMTISLWFSVSD
jgi:hypothetical protein